MLHSPLSPSPTSIEARYASVPQRSKESETGDTRTFDTNYEKKQWISSTVSHVTHTDTEYRPGSMAFQDDKNDYPSTDPSHPAVRKRSSRFDAEVLIADFLSIGIPLGLLIFATLVWLKDQIEAPTKQIEEWVNAASILSTLFPVFFAAVVGRLMAQAARWKLESGSTLKSLEQLLGSKTVGGALLTPYHLRTLNALGLTLLLLWAFSPLGAQAMLRIVEVRLTPATDPSSAMYFDTRGRSLFPDWSSASGGAQLTGQVKMDQIASIYNGLLLAPATIKSDTVDLFGNVKVPLLSSLKTKPEGGGWRDVPRGDVPYSALVGIPMLDISTGNTTFLMESNYLELTCEKPKKLERDGEFIRLNSSAIGDYYYFGNSTPPNGTFQGRPVTNGTHGSDSFFHVTQLYPWSLASNSFVDGSWSNGEWVSYHGNESEDELPWGWAGRLSDGFLLFEHEKDIETRPTTLYFSTVVVSQVLGGVKYPFETYCNASQSYVESKVTCEKSDSDSREVCRVDSMRPSQKDNPPEDITLLSFPRIFDMVSKHMPFTTGENVATMSNSDLTLQYLADPSLANISEGLSVQLSTIDKEDFTLRLTQVLNSYLHLGQMYTSTLGFNTNDGSSPLSYNITAESRVTNLLTVYHVPRTWATLCVVSCMVMLTGGTASVLFAHLALGPEVFGFASTAIRDNKYMEIPEEASMLDGPQISSALDQTRVRFGLIRGAWGHKIGVGLQESVSSIREALRAKS